MQRGFHDSTYLNDPITLCTHGQALSLTKEFQVRALTRNASSEAAQALVERGIEVVSADLAHKQSLLRVRSSKHWLCNSDFAHVKQLSQQ